MYNSCFASYPLGHYFSSMWYSISKLLVKLLSFLLFFSDKKMLAQLKSEAAQLAAQLMKKEQDAKDAKDLELKEAKILLGQWKKRFITMCITFWLYLDKKLEEAK